jgi:hypothetical protein
MALSRYYASENDFQQFRSTLKLQTCPHCGKTGTLNLHGALHGYSDQGGSPSRVLRGRRLFCNNRHRRSGCGKTVSLWLAPFLRGCILTLQTLWIFLAGILAGLTKADAFRRTKAILHPTTAYRVFRRMEQSQSRLRVALARRFQPPEGSTSASPFIATLVHLQTAFPHARCPPAEYQLLFQASFPV